MSRQTIRISLDDQTAQGQYVNFANIIHSPSEFVIDLGRIVPGRNDVKVYSRVIMTPLHAKQLLEALAQMDGVIVALLSFFYVRKMVRVGEVE